MHDDQFTTTGTVTECLRGFYRVKLSNGHTVLAYPSGRLRKARIKCLPDDTVTVAVSSYDLDRARIVYRNAT